MTETPRTEVAVRIRQDGRIVCAAMHPAEHGDTYVGDKLHYDLAIASTLVTEPWQATLGRGGHAAHGEWWWSGHVPVDVVL